MTTALLKKKPFPFKLFLSEILSKFYTMADAEDLHSPFIANCVFNAFLSYTSVMLNILMIHAIRKTSSLQIPSKTLLLSLAVSDLGVGLIVQPLYIVVLVTQIEQNTSNKVFEVFIGILNIFAHASFFSVLALTADRFLAIHLHLRYQELVTHKRVVSVVMSTWVLSAILCPLDSLWLPREAIVIYLVINIAVLVTSALLHYKIFVVVRHQMRQIQAQQVQQVIQNGKIANITRLKKSVACTFYIYIVFLVCYVPAICLTLSKMISRSNGPDVWSYYVNSLVFLNSSLNPLIYCWQLRCIRQTVFTMLRNVYYTYRKTPETVSELTVSLG